MNELLERDLDCTPGTTSDNYTLSYDAAGNLTDDGKDYEYVYDAFYRLREIRDQASDLVAEYRYNGLGHRIAVHADTDTDGDVDASDEWEYLVYDERWRLVARFIESESNPRQEFLHHQAGLDGRGGSSYIDLVALRDRDEDANGTLEERVYYCQNWRADVSALVDVDGGMLEWVKYSAYGVPFGLPAGDADSDGDCDSADLSQVQTWIGASQYDVRGDTDLDGDLDGYDEAIVTALDGFTLGRGSLSGKNSHRGYTGFPFAYGAWLARMRAMHSALGSWLTRDPLRYIDSLNLYSFCAQSPFIGRDPTGTSLTFICDKEADQAFKQWVLCIMGCYLECSEAFADAYWRAVKSPHKHCVRENKPGDHVPGAAAWTDCTENESSSDCAGGSTIVLFPGRASSGTGSTTAVLGHELVHSNQCDDAAASTPPQSQPKPGTSRFKQWESKASKAERAMVKHCPDCDSQCPPP